MAEAIGPMIDGRKQYVESLERAGVRNNGDPAEHMRQLQHAAQQGNPWARERYQHHQRDAMGAESERGREAEQGARRWNEAAYYTDTLATGVTLGANHSLQRMGDKAMHGDTEGTVTELVTAAVQVASAAGAAKAVVGVGKAAWARGLRTFRGAPATAVEAGEGAGVVQAVPRPAPQSAPRTPATRVSEALLRARPKRVERPARPAPVDGPVHTPPTVDGPVHTPPTAVDGPVHARLTAVEPPEPTTLHYAPPARPLTARVGQYQPTGDDPGAAEWLQNMQRLRRAAGR